MRIWIVALALLMALGAVAHAQPEGRRQLTPDELRQLQKNRMVDADDLAAAQQGQEAPAKPKPPAPPEDRDRTQGSGKGMAALFWLFALATVGGSIFVITRRNLIAAVMGMVGTFFGVAAIYMMLYADFLAVIQMLVYAGAIMVLFVFVVMILNKPEDEPWGMVGLPGKALAGLAMLYLTFRLGGTLWGVEVPERAMVRPPPVEIIVGRDEIKNADGQVVSKKLRTEKRDWGSTAAVGETLFSKYLFPFEAVSILLLISVVGAIAVARPLSDRSPDGSRGDDDGEPAPEETPA